MGYVSARKPRVNVPLEKSDREWVLDQTKDWQPDHGRGRRPNEKLGPAIVHMIQQMRATGKVSIIRGELLPREDRGILDSLKALRTEHREVFDAILRLAAKAAGSEESARAVVAFDAALPERDSAAKRPGTVRRPSARAGKG